MHSIHFMFAYHYFHKTSEPVHCVKASVGGIAYVHRCAYLRVFVFLCVCMYKLLMHLTEPPKTKGHTGKNKSLQRTIIMNPAMKTPVCASPRFSSLHYSFADRKTNINISNININSHKTFIPLRN